jgi:hypothetical protein
VQIILTTAVNTNKERTVAMIIDDIDEIQLVGLEGDVQDKINPTKSLFCL